MISVLISQSRGLAVFDDGTALAALLDEDGEPELLADWELTRLLRDTNDIEALSLPGLSDLRVALRDRRLREEALHAVLLVIDSETSMPLRAAAAETLVRMLQVQTSSDAIEQWLEGVLMSIPAPPEVDFAGAKRLLRHEAVELIERLEKYQTRIRAVVAAFVAACRKSGVNSRSSLRRRAVERGWFRALVLGERPSLGESDEVRGLVEQWSSILVETKSTRAFVARPNAMDTTVSDYHKNLDDTGRIVVPPNHDANVHEDENFVGRDVVAAHKFTVESTVQNSSRKIVGGYVLLEDLDLRKAERLLCQQALMRTGNIVEAARLLGITRHALKRRMLKHRLEWPDASNVKPMPWVYPKGIFDKKPERDERVRSRRIVNRVVKPKFFGRD